MCSRLSDSSRASTAISWLGRGGLWKRSFIRRQNLLRRQAVALSQWKCGCVPRRFKPQLAFIFIACRFLKMYLFISSIFSQSTIIHMYLALLFCADLSLNKAIKAQKTHCMNWIAFIDQAHVKTHVNSSYYFGFWCTQNGLKGIKSIG